MMAGVNGSAKATETLQPQKQQSEDPAETNGFAETNGVYINGTSSHSVSNGATTMNGYGSGPASPPPMTKRQTSETDYESNFETVEEERLLKLMRANVVKLNPETKVNLSCSHSLPLGLATPHTLEALLCRGLSHTFDRDRSHLSHSFKEQLLARQALSVS
jgi:hypothetical protein